MNIQIQKNEYSVELQIFLRFTNSDVFYWYKNMCCEVNSKNIHKIATNAKLQSNI